MRRTLFISISILLIHSLILSCSNSAKVNDSKNNNTESEMSGKKEMAGPPVIVYRTKADFFDKVPVTLSEDKSEIISYPGVKDIYYNGEFSYPTKLSNGYLLDNRGIDPNSAFLNLTYEEYSILESTPTKSELYSLILEKDPFVEMYNCGNKYKYKDIIQELNALIDGNKLEMQKRLK
jgi:hypothetical protein